MSNKFQHSYLSKFLSKQNLKNCLVLSIVGIFLYLAPRYCVPDMTFMGDAADVVEEVYPILERSGLCIKKAYCIGYTYGVQPIAGGGGFILVIKGDPDKKVIREIEGVIQKKFWDTPQIKNILFRVCARKTPLPLHGEVVEPCRQITYEKKFKR